MLRKRMGWAVLMVLGLLCACEKVNLGTDSDGPTEVTDGVRVRFCVDKFEQVPFDTPSADSRASVNISDICSRLSFAFFRTDGSLYVAKHQTAEEAGFGSLDISLPQDTYRVVVIAHSGSGTPTFAAADSIRFKDNKLTDTFFGSLSGDCGGPRQHLQPVAEKGGGQVQVGGGRCYACRGEADALLLYGRQFYPQCDKRLRTGELATDGTARGDGR